MRMKTVLLLLIGVFSFATLSPSFAITSVTTSATSSIEQQNSNGAKAFKTQKKASKFQKLLQKAGIDLQDPVEKWLWYGVGLIGLAVILAVLKVLVGLYGAIALAGIICLVIWFIKKGGA